MPEKQKYDYVYCTNATCTYHAMFLLADKPAALREGASCPMCKTGRISLIEYDRAAPLPSSGASIDTGVVLPAEPYGGFILGWGDDDDSTVWEKQHRTEARHAGARYVAELQRDLLRLGFFTIERWGSVAAFGKFGDVLMFAVLDFKRHLKRFYGVPASDDPALVKPHTAGTAPPGSIYSRELQNPAILFARGTSWEAALTKAQTQFRAFKPKWEARRKKGLIASSSALDEAERRLIALDEDGKKLAQQHPESPEDVQALAARVGSEGERVDGQPSPAGHVTIGQVRARIQQLLAIARQAASEARKTEEAFLVIGLLYAELKAEVDARNDLVARIQRARSDFGWALPPYAQANVNAMQSNVATSVARWLSPTGALEALSNAIATADSEWTMFSDRPAGWSELRGLIGSLRSVLSVYHDRISDPKLDGHSLFEGYRQELREFARVDAHTARCIRELVFTGALNGRNAFLRPMNEEIDKSDPDIGEIVDALHVTTRGILRTRSNTAIPILEFIFKHESGNRHTIPIGGNEFVIMGIDWDNTGSPDKALFHEHSTNPSHFSQGRGWGKTQLTMADESDGALKWECGIPYNADRGAPRPNPDVIRSVRGNLASGIRLFIANKFGNFSKNQDCTYKDKYQCKDCVKNLTVTPKLGPEGKDGKRPIVRKGPSIDFDDEGTEFRRVRSGGEKGSIQSYAVKDVATLRAHLRSGKYAIPSLTVTDDTPDAELEPHCVEFPCSWFEAVLRYCGVGEQAYLYALEAMWTMQDPSHKG